MDFLSLITWEVTPEIFSLGPITVRWYGLLFSLGFVIGYQITARIFKQEGIEEKYLDSLLMFMLIATVVGARLCTAFSTIPIIT